MIPNISLRYPVLFSMIKDYSRYVYFDMLLRPLKFPVLMIFNHWLTPTPPPLLKVYLSVIMFEKYLLNRVFFFIYVMAMLQYILHVFMLIRIHYWERKFILFSNNFSGFFNLIIDFLSTSSMAIMGFSRNILLECTVLVDILLLWKAFPNSTLLKGHVICPVKHQFSWIYSRRDSLGKLTNTHYKCNYFV